MAALSSNAPAAPAAPRSYDPEINDMASYIHKHEIKSDLAVSAPPYTLLNRIFQQGRQTVLIMTVV